MRNSFNLSGKGKEAMNQCYRVVWSQVRNCYVVVSELVGCGQHKTGRRRKGATVFAMAALLAVSMGKPVSEAAEPYKILVDRKGNVISTETLSSGTGEQTVQNSIADGVYSISIGKGAETKGDYAVAIGTGNVAGGTNSIVFGDRNYTGITPETNDKGVPYFRYQTSEGIAYATLDGSKIYTLADGTPWFDADMPIVVGKDGQTYRVNYNTKLIRKVVIQTDEAISLGNAMGLDSVDFEKVYGKLLTDKKIAGSGALAFGKNNLAIGDYSLAHGMDSWASGENATAFGYHAAANGKNSTAWGDHTTADYRIEYFSNGTTAYIKNSDGKNVYVNQNGIKLLMDAKGEPFTYYSQTIPVGQDGNGYVEKYVRGKGYQKFKVTVNADGSLSIATTPAEGDIAYQTVEGDFETVENNTAFGKNTVASGNQATAWGYGNVASGENATSWGEDNVASGQNATAWGEDTVASGWNASAWGMDAVASGENTTAWGEYSIAAGVRATAWGDESKAYGEDSTAFGDNSIAGGNNSLAALGGKTGVEDNDDYTDGQNSAAIGKDAWAKVNDSMALGSRSVAEREAGQGADHQLHSGYDIATGKESTSTDSVWRSTESAIAVGNPEENVTRQITGVAAGYEDTDAVNVAQLKEVRKMASTQTIVQAGSDNISVHGSSGTDGNKIYVVDLSKDITLGKDDDGDKTVSISGTHGTITAGTGDHKVIVDGSTGQIVAGGDHGVKIGKIEKGDSSLTIFDKDGNATGETDKTGKYVTNLENKTWNKDGSYISGRAATEDQLHQVESNINSKIGNVNEKIDKVTKQHTTVSVNGNTEKGNLILKKTDATDTAGANYDISLSHDVTIGSTGENGKDGKMTITSQDGIKSIMADGKTGALLFKNGQSETAVQAGQAVKGVDSAADIQRITADGHTVATMDDGMKYSGDSGNAAVKLNKNVQIYGGATEYADGNNIGVVASQDGNHAKLQIMLAKNLNGINSLEAATINVKTVHSDTFQAGNTVVNNRGLSIEGNDNHQNITIQQGLVDMGGNKIENVAPGRIGSDSMDAVNGSQLYAANQNIANLSGEVNKLDSRVNRVGANAAALAALHPQDFDPDNKWDFAAGYGNYKDANAMAFGAYYRPNEDTMFSIGGSFGGGENMVNAGISWKFGQKNHVSRSRVSMAKEILSMKVQIEALTKKLAVYESGQPVKRISLSGGTAVFPDLPENHWAYQYVKTLAAKGYLQGYPDGEFKGNRALTRYEYAAIIYRALQNGAPSDGDMARSVDEFGPELVKVQSIDRFRVDRISGKDTDRHKVERIRINDKDNRGENEYRDLYGSHIVRQSARKS